MSDLSIKSASDAAYSQMRHSASAADSKVSNPVASVAKQSAKVDVSSFVTSPKGVVDPSSGVFVLQYRDGETGEVTQQYPSKKAVAAYKSTPSGEAAASAPVQSSPTAPTTDPSGSVSISSGDIAGSSPSVGTEGASIPTGTAAE